MMKLTPNSLFVGQNIISKDIVDSTNNVAIRLLSQSRLPEGSVVIANEQSSGKGQQGAKWESEYCKNLLASFIFYPAFVATKNIFHLNITFSLALYDFANALLKEHVSVKWPNDLYYENKKLAGIFIENSIRNSRLNYSVIGIGININQTAFSPNAANATSFKTVLNKEVNMDDAFKLLCESIEARYLQLKSGKTELLRNEYIKSLFGFNTYAIYKASGKTFSGKIVNIQDDGRLVVEKTDGMKEIYGFKEIEFVI